MSSLLAAPRVVPARPLAQLASIRPTRHYRKRVDLVFRTVGERTSLLALALAEKHIDPDRVHVIENVKPFSQAVARMLKIEHRADTVVYMDADCLILEDMRPFLEANERAYVDCWVHDRFRGRIHCGVHITRGDVVEEMQRVSPPEDDLAYVLRPESRLRNVAMRRLGLNKAYKSFQILHDHFQAWEHIYFKYALRELRSRTSNQRARLERAMIDWGDDPEFLVARQAVLDTRARVPEKAATAIVDRYIAGLEETSRVAVQRMGIDRQGELTMNEVQARSEDHTRPAIRTWGDPRIFGLGLSRTGTRSLTTALNVMGWDVLHYPTDQEHFEQLARGDYRFSLLEQYDGMTDINVAPYYAQLDRRYPGSKFILTVRDKDPWLRSCSNHWTGRDAFAPAETPEQESHMRVRRLLRAAVYGCYNYDAERFSWVYDQHVRNVRQYFEGRPDDLLVLDVCGGQGWERLCGFLGRDNPGVPFPHKGNKLSASMARADLETRD